MSTISIATPNNAVANTPFTMSGTMTGYTSAPSLTYVDDEVLPAITGVKETSATANSVTLTWNPIQVSTTPISSSGVTATTFSFSHPGLPAGIHTTEVSDGTVGSTVKYTVASISASESPEGTLVETVGPTITDSVGDIYALTSTHRITINGVIDTRTGSSTVDVLYYHNHLVWQQNSKGTWYYTKSASDSWHQASGPIVTHFGVLAELLSLKSLLTNSQQVNACNRIISDVNALMP